MSNKTTIFNGIKQDAIKQIEEAMDELKDAVNDVADDVQIAQNKQKEEFIGANIDDKIEVLQNELQTDNDISSSDEVDEKQENKQQSYGKFKNPEQLLRAYQELEKEFTRRSQKLAQYESGEIELSEQEWKNQVDKFFENTPSARAFAKDIAKEIVSHPELKKDRNCLSVALTRVLVDKFRTPEQLVADGQFLKEYVLSSPQIKDVIIAEYIDGLQKGKPPVTLGVGGLQCVAPSLKPKSIQEAGAMFLKNNE